MLAQSAALLFFVPEKLADGEPFERFLEFALMSRNDARKRWRQLGPQRHFALAFIGEIKKLIDNLRAALFFVKLGGLQNRAFPFHKAIAARDLAPAREYVIALRTVIGQE